MERPPRERLKRFGMRALRHRGRSCCRSPSHDQPGRRLGRPLEASESRYANESDEIIEITAGERAPPETCHPLDIVGSRTAPLDLVNLRSRSRRRDFWAFRLDHVFREARLLRLCSRRRRTLTSLKARRLPVARVRSMPKRNVAMDRDKPGSLRSAAPGCSIGARGNLTCR